MVITAADIEAMEYDPQAGILYDRDIDHSENSFGR